MIVVDSFTPSKEYAVLAEHPVHLAHPSPVCWSPDSKLLLVGGADGHVWAYSAAVGAPGGLPDLADADFLPGAAAFPERPAAPPELVRAWTPAVPPPAAALLGEAHKAPASREGARAAAKRYAAELLKRDAEKREALKAQRKRFPDVRRSATLDPPAPEAAEDMASRMEGPVTALAWHPWAALVASAGGGCGGGRAGGGRAALWAPPAGAGEAVGGGGGGGGGGAEDDALMAPVV